jgi:glutamine phosphoribosylpyrophosphate amidotransferase
MLGPPPLRQQGEAEGKTTREIIRCLERYVAREVYMALTAPPGKPASIGHA